MPKNSQKFPISPKILFDHKVPPLYLQPLVFDKQDNFHAEFLSLDFTDYIKQAFKLVSRSPVGPINLCLDLEV